MITVGVGQATGPPAFDLLSADKLLAILIDTLLISLRTEYGLGQFGLCPTRTILDQKEQYVCDRKSHNCSMCVRRMWEIVAR